MITILIAHPDLRIGAALSAMIDGIFAEFNTNSVSILTAGDFDEAVFYVRRHPIRLAFFDVELFRENVPAWPASIRKRSMWKVLMMPEAKLKSYGNEQNESSRVEILIRPVEREKLKGLVRRFLARDKSANRIPRGILNQQKG